MSAARDARGGAAVSAAFAAGREAGRPLVIPFITAGYPTASATVPLIEALAGAGADMIEIGMPFSDPLADGPTIQRASEIALRNGMTVRKTLALVREARQARGGGSARKNADTGGSAGAAAGHTPQGAGSVGGAGAAARRTPIILMGYCNPLYAYGLPAFLADAAEAGVDGLIIPDMPPDEAGELIDGCCGAGLSATFLVAPNAPDERIRRVDQASTHFSYCVTVTGVTGARAELQARTLEFLRRMRVLAEKPFVTGFGIKRPEHVEALGPHTDGVVVGSALIDAIEAAGGATAGDAEAASAAAAIVAPLCEAAARLAAQAGAGGGGDS